MCFEGITVVHFECFINRNDRWTTRNNRYLNGPIIILNLDGIKYAFKKIPYREGVGHFANIYGMVDF